MNVRDSITPFDDSGWIAKIAAFRQYLGDVRAKLVPVPIATASELEEVETTVKPRRTPRKKAA